MILDAFVNIKTMRKNLCSNFRSDHEMVTENIYIIFDPEESGLVGFDQLLLAFSMSMKGTGRNKKLLKKTFDITIILVHNLAVQLIF